MPSSLEAFPLADDRYSRGIVFGFSFDEEGKAQPLPLGAAPDIAEPGPGYLWLHVNLADNRATTWLHGLDALPEEAKDVMLEAGSHDRIDIAGHVLAGAFVDMRLDFSNATEDMAQLRFILGPRFLITGRRQSLRSIEATRASILAGTAIDTPIDLFEAIVDRETDALATAATQLAQSVDRIEDRILGDQIDDEPQKLGTLRRRAVGLHRQLARLMSLFRRVEQAPASRLPSDIRAAAGRIAQRLESVNQEVVSSQDRARLLQDEVAAKMAAQTNRQLYVLSLLTAVFLPATLVTGLFGMNTKGLPWESDEHGFLLASLLAGAAALLVYVLLRRLTASR
jgi:Mg2+ and Co2+ transporter CorA